MRQAIALLFVATFAAAQEAPAAPPPSREISLRDAIELGLAYNLGLRSSRLGALMARLDVDAANAAWDVTVTAETGGGESQSPSRSTLSGADVVDADNFNFAFGVTKPLRVGPSLGLNWRTDRTFTNSSFSTVNPAYDTALELTLTVPLLRGRGRRVQEADLRAARWSSEASRLGLLQEAADMIQRVGAAYWALVYATERVEVVAKSLQVSREIEEAERRKLRPEIGRSTQLDVTKAEAETKRREAALIQSQLDAANASDDLRLLILPFSGGPGDRVVLRAVGRPDEIPAMPPLEQAVETALRRRLELRQRDAEIARLKEFVVKAEDALRLQLDFRAAVSWAGVDRQFDGAASDTLRGQTPSASAGLALVWTAGRRAARASLRRAQLELERSRVDRRQLVNEIILEVRKAHRAVLSTQREIEALREEVRAADASLKGERLRLNRGSATVLDVSQIGEDLTDAELRLLQARADLLVARVDFERAAGTLLERTGVDLGPDLDLTRNGAPVEKPR